MLEGRTDYEVPVQHIFPVGAPAEKKKPFLTKERVISAGVGIVAFHGVKWGTQKLTRWWLESQFKSLEDEEESYTAGAPKRTTDSH